METWTGRPDKPCGRTKCASPDVRVHLGKEHLDPRSDLYDGPGSLFQVLPLAVRESARKIAREHPDVMPEVVDLANQIQRLRDQVTHVRVDRDRQVREAMARSEDCEHHGTEIRLLGEQVHAIGEAERRNDQGRVALVGFLQVIDDVVLAYKNGTMAQDITVARVMGALEKSAATAHRQHMRAWKR